MQWRKWKPYVLWIVLTEAVGFLSGILSREGTQYFRGYVNQPPLSPPGWLFPVVWTILYALMGIGAARVWMTEDSPQRSEGLNWFIFQLILNFFWSLIFFNAQAYGVASVWIVILWASVFIMTLKFYRVDPLAAWLQVPYLLWLTFACYLAFGVWFLN